MKDLDDQCRVINRLFSPSLRKLQATSIHSNREKLESYKNYWDAPLGDYFKQKNSDFLKSQGILQRLYFCDSLALAVKHAWFHAALQQLKLGAQVRIDEINDELLNSDKDPYHDYGIYYQDHSEPCVLLAPRSENLGRTLNTELVFDESVSYRQDFEAIWARHARDELHIEPDNMEAQDLHPATFDVSSLRSLFGDSLIFRSMQHPTTHQSLIPQSRGDSHQNRRNIGVPRKFQQQYADILWNYVTNAYPGVAQIIYVGDTVENDGGLIRNLQRKGVDVYGYICEPELGKSEIDRLWFKRTFYTTRWSDLSKFNKSIPENRDQRRLAIFDIDQTTWGPKGLNESPLKQSRSGAIRRPLTSYVSGGNDNLLSALIDAAIYIYTKISSIDYVALTQDNEDYKAPLAVYLPLGIASDLSGEIPITIKNGEVDRATVEELLKDQFNRCDIDAFLSSLIPAFAKSVLTQHMDSMGLKVDMIRTDVFQLFSNMKIGKAAPFSRFRAYELEELHDSATKRSTSISEMLTINKSVLDYITYLKARGVDILGVSDRPEEATFNEHHSLLETCIQVYGYDLSAAFAN